jgi:hypothetical protein
MGLDVPQQFEEAVPEYPTVLDCVIWVPDAEALILVAMRRQGAVRVDTRRARTGLLKADFYVSPLVVKDVDRHTIDPTATGDG